MTTYRQLLSQRERIRSIVARHKGANPRLFGSVASGKQHDSSDVDLLIDMMPGGSLLDLVNMQMELSKEIGVQFDVNTPRSLPKKWRDTVMQGAVAL